MLIYESSVISDFSGRNRWLSNFATGEVTVYGYTFQNREAAFQAMKSTDPQVQEKFLHLTGSAAKKLGRTIKLRNDWEEIKEVVMYNVCKAFFMQHEDMRAKLIETGLFTYLMEGNDWHDNTWGVCCCKKCQPKGGQNKLGHILMQIRADFILSKE